MGRSPCCDKANVKRGPWSPEEDAKLKDYIEKYGIGGNWIALPRKVGLKRCGKSCRLRWLNYLRPNIKHGEFSSEEDRVICTLYSSIGSRWSIIASKLPGRTDNDIKNYWNTKLKKKLIGNNKNNNKMILSSTTSETNTKKYQHNPIISSPLLPPSYQTMSFSNNNSTLLTFGLDHQQPQQPSTTINQALIPKEIIPTIDKGYSWSASKKYNNNNQALMLKEIIPTIDRGYSWSAPGKYYNNQALKIEDHNNNDIYDSYNGSGLWGQNSHQNNNNNNNNNNTNP